MQTLSDVNLIHYDNHFQQSLMNISKKQIKEVALTLSIQTFKATSATTLLTITFLTHSRKFEAEVCNSIHTLATFHVQCGY